MTVITDAGAEPATRLSFVIFKKQFARRMPPGRGTHAGQRSSVLVGVPGSAATARLAIGKTRVHAARRQTAGCACLALGKAGVHAFAGISDAEALNAPGVVMGRRRS